MPTYTNSGTAPVYFNSPPLKIEAGATASLDYFLRHLPSGVTKTSDSPTVSPWALLATVASAPSEAIDTSAWNKVVIHNVSSENITVSANGDDTSAMVILPAAKETWGQGGETLYSPVVQRSGQDATLFGFIKVLTKPGTGNVYIWGTNVASF